MPMYLVEVSALLEIEAATPEKAAEMGSFVATDHELNYDVTVREQHKFGITPVLHHITTRE
jgi:hypothetical protein